MSWNATVDRTAAEDLEQAIMDAVATPQAGVEEEQRIQVACAKNAAISIFRDGGAGDPKVGFFRVSMGGHAMPKDMEVTSNTGVPSCYANVYRSYP
jgi:hypothetical protein